MARGRKAPGPRGLALVGSLVQLRRDVLRLLRDSREQYGDVVRFRFGTQVIHLIAHPEHIQQVLLTNQHNYNKDTRSSAKIRSVTGSGLLTSNGPYWLRQRRLIQPSFLPQRIASFIDIMTTTTAGMLDRWRSKAETGQAFDVSSEMMRLTCDIVAQALLGADVSRDLDSIEQSATVVMEHAWRRLERIVDLPSILPTPANLRNRRAVERLERVVYRIIEKRRRQTGSSDGDLLGSLLRGKDEDTGASMSDEEIRNETITLLLAGHETTANSLTWTWYLLAKHPEVARRIRDEVLAVLGDRAPTVDDLTRLEFTTRAYRESIRLFPPIWIMERRAIGADAIAGYEIPGGSSVVICPYVTHRHPGFWDNPEVFNPDRFVPNRIAKTSPYAYIPFGAGQRLCIGANFALQEALVIIAMVMQRYRFELVSGQPVKPQPGITLRVRDGLAMILRPLDTTR